MKDFQVSGEASRRMMALCIGQQVEMEWQKAENRLVLYCMWDRCLVKFRGREMLESRAASGLRSTLVRREAVAWM